MKRVLTKNASGYSLYKWANSVLPDNSTTLINHRSYYFAEKDMIYIGMTGFFKYADREEINSYLKKN